MKYAFLILAFVFCAQPVAAQGVISGEAQTISEMNRVKPLQNPQYAKAEDVLNRRILDRKNKVVADLRDIIIAPGGAVHMLQVEFSRLGLSAPVYLNYGDLKTHPSRRAYTLGFTDDELAGFYPSLLEQTQTAAGADGALSLQKIRGAEVVDSDDRHIGAAQEILMNADGDRAQAVYVSLTTGVLHGEGVAIPFSSVQFQNEDGVPTARIASTLADAMIQYASQ